MGKRGGRIPEGTGAGTFYFRTSGWGNYCTDKSLTGEVFAMDPGARTRVQEHYPD